VTVRIKSSAREVKVRLIILPFADFLDRDGGCFKFERLSY
jgi:hypothetical protein